MSNYPKWGSIPRLFNETCAITEKVDGTNGLIYIEDAENEPYELYGEVEHACLEDGTFCVYAGSRRRWITPTSDNHGFATWVWENAEALALGLGAGHHYGEWAGPGINGNRHGLVEKSFFLFNWRKFNKLTEEQDDALPISVEVVPVLEVDIPAHRAVESAENWADELEQNGSYAGPGINAEGVVLRSDLTGQSWKYFCGGVEANATSKGGTREQNLAKFAAKELVA